MLNIRLVDDWVVSISGCKVEHDTSNTLSVMTGVCRLVDARHGTRC